MIGRVGTIFGAHGINISSAAVGHAARRQPTARSERLAAMVVTTDAAVPRRGRRGDRRLRGLRQRLVGRARLSSADRDRLAPQRCAAVVITKHGGPGVLQVQERPDPTLGAGPGAHRRRRGGHQLRRRDGAHGALPRRAQAAVRGRLRGRRHDARAGRGRAGPESRPARARGHDVRRLRLAGGRARPTTSSRCRTGSRFEQGAAIPVNYATAWAGLIGYGSLQPGERVLCTPPAAASASPPRRSPSAPAPRSTARPRPASTQRIAELGVDHPLDYTQRRLGARACRSST